MSVTFAIESLPTGEFSARCLETNVSVSGAREYVEAVATNHRVLCSDCNVYGIFVTAVVDIDEAFEVNLSNVNAQSILAMLGIDTQDGDLAGSEDAETFLGRVILALADDFDDSGIPAVTDGNVTDCGVAPGYFDARLNTLHTIASEARRLGRSVVWS